MNGAGRVSAASRLASDTALQSMAEGP